MGKFNLRVNPTPHGFYNRTKGIILSLLTYCKVDLGMNTGLPLFQIADIVSVHGIDYQSAKVCICRNHGYHYLSRKAKAAQQGHAYYIYTISSDGNRWVNKWIPQDMRQQILAPMIPKLPNNGNNDIKGLFS